ncbi:hypothetical protein T11_7285, partial [Trichinella zimbabwensis]
LLKYYCFKNCYKRSTQAQYFLDAYRVLKTIKHKVTVYFDCSGLTTVTY